MNMVSLYNLLSSNDVYRQIKNPKFEVFFYDMVFGRYSNTLWIAFANIKHLHKKANS